MSTYAEFIAAFLPKSKQNSRLARMIGKACDDLDAARRAAALLPDEDYKSALAEIKQLNEQILQEAADGMRRPKEATVAMEDLRIKTAGLKDKLAKKGKVAVADPAKRIDRALSSTLATIAQARKGTREIADEDEGN